MAEQFNAAQEETVMRYLKKRRMHVRVFLLLASAAVVCYIAAGALTVWKGMEKNRRYEILTGVADSTDYADKLASYKEAIRLLPQRTEAYVKLLEAYESNGVFDREESGEFTALYNRANSLGTEAGGGELTYLAGRMYFAMYTEDGAPVSMSAKVQKAASYFQACIDNPPEDERLAAAAGCYDTICCFYKDYILASSVTKELGVSDLEALLASANSAISALKDGMDHDKLMLASSICNLLYDQRSEFARVAPGILPDVTALYENAVALAMTADVTNAESVRMQTSILEYSESFLTAIRCAFEEAADGND